MTNPDNIVRVRARLEGRASVYEANGWAQGYTNGLLSGNGVLPNTVPNMNVLVGGSQNNPDVVIAENADGYKIALDIVGQQPIAITAPASQNRISAIVAYTDDLSLASTDSAITGSPSSCGLIVVNGNVASTPTEPSDATIRSAITSDGATGSQACYCVIATILVSSATTAISSSLIAPKTAAISASNIDFATLGGNYSTTESNTKFTWIDGRSIYKKTFVVPIPSSGNSTAFNHNISNLGSYIKAEGVAVFSNGTTTRFLSTFYEDGNGLDHQYSCSIYGGSTTSNNITLTFGSGYHGGTAYITIYYTKTS